MSEFSSGFAFLFAYVPHTPKSLAELSGVPAIRLQHLALRNFAEKNDIKIVKAFPDFTTNREKAFIDRSKFEQAVAAARVNKLPLLIANIRDLLIRTKSDQIKPCMDRLDGIEADIFDVASARYWSSFDHAARLGIVSAALAHKEVGRAISLGKKLSEPAQLNIKLNQLAGAQANRRKADRQAEHLRTIVEELEAKLPPGDSLSPSVLMHRLNELGIKAARSDKWSLNGAKRLLARLRDSADSKSPD